MKPDFWSKVSKDCWVWTGACNRVGYGHLFWGGEWWLAHRLSWFLTKGQIPKGMLVCHRCDNPCCVNPDHLFLGTQSDNLRDSVKKGRWNNGDRHWTRRHPEKVTCGSSHWNAKLTDSSAREILQMAMSGHSQRALAKRFGVSPRTIQDLLRGATWKHIHNQQGGAGV